LLQYNNILVIQTAFIGDAILVSSLIEKLHATFPAARISVLVRGGNESVYKGHPFLHDVLVWDKRSGKLRNLFRMIREVRNRRFDCVVTGHRYMSSGLIAAFSGARHVAGFKENPMSFAFNHTARHRIGDGRHEIERLNSLVEDFAGNEAAQPRLYPADEDHRMAAQFQSAPYVCMAPASVWFTKQLPVENGSRFAIQLRRIRLYILLADLKTMNCASASVRPHVIPE
jgi:heptosyltransferase-2